MTDYTIHVATNQGKAPRGVYTRDGIVTIMPGQTKEIAIADDIAKEEWDFLSFGQPVASDDPDEKPGLAGKNKDELIAIAQAEGVQLEDDMTNKDIRSAIELHREP